MYALSMRQIQTHLRYSSFTPFTDGTLFMQLLDMLFRVSIANLWNKIALGTFKGQIRLSGRHYNSKTFLVLRDSTKHFGWLIPD